MVQIQKITQKEWDNYVKPQLYSSGFTLQEREAIDRAFSQHLRDVDIEDKRPFLGEAPKGISEKELQETMAELRDKNSVISKDSQVRLYEYPQKLGQLEKILVEALKKSKESRWF